MYRPFGEDHLLSRHKRRLYFVLLFLAFLILFILLRDGALSPVPPNAPSASKYVDIWVGIMTSFFVVSLVELVPDLLNELSRHSREARFRRLFGLDPGGEACLVFAHRTLADDSVWQLAYPPPPVMGQTPVCEGTRAWLAVPDIRGAIYIANEISGMGCRINVIHDKDVVGIARPELCMVSIGLGFNGYTKWLAHEADENFFKISYGRSLNRRFSGITDGFTVSGQEPPATESSDNALVARIVTPLPGGKRRVSFLCAGRTAAGTAAAGYFLANCWDQLFRLYEQNGRDPENESLRVIISHIADADAQQSHDSSGEVRSEKEWAPVFMKAKGLASARAAAHRP